MILRLDPHPDLREKLPECPPWHDSHWRHGREVAGIASDMLDMMKDLGGVGLAATQVGVPWRMFVADFGVFIEPRIFTGLVDTENQVEMEEGCLSVPGRVEKITRPQTVTLAAFDLTGRHYNLPLTGLAARIAQHEVDHLDGILFTDHLKERP